MKRAIIGCEILKKDIGGLIEKIPYEADTVWLDQELHAFPEKLRDAIQETIDGLKGYDEIILTFLLCGNALLGIKSDNSVLRFIKGDDCIYADLCCRDDYLELRSTSFFVSHSWLQTERNIVTEYQRTVDKYGEKRAKHIWEIMYKNYKYLAYMQLEDEDDELTPEEAARMRFMAECAKVEIKTVKGSLEMYEKLLSLTDDPGIAVIEKGHAITAEDTRPPKL